MRIVRLSHSNIDRLMVEAVAEARRRGIAMRQLPFRSSDVDGVHTDRDGSSDGVWFRLVDGRVFDTLGRDCDPNPMHYDTLRR